MVHTLRICYPKRRRSSRVCSPRLKTGYTPKRLVARLSKAEACADSVVQGEDATKSAYVEKLDKLKAVGGPAAFRYKENEDRPAAVKRLRETLSKYYSKATGNEERYAHLSEVSNECLNRVQSC